MTRREVRGAEGRVVGMVTSFGELPLSVTRAAERNLRRGAPLGHTGPNVAW
jgi:hypothetical protein